MLPRSTKVSNGHITTLDWVKMAWKFKKSPTFDPMQVEFLYHHF